MTGFGALSMIAGGGKAPPPRPDADVERVDDEPDAGRRVAIVEDELMVAWSLESMLQELGYTVVGTFARGEAALAQLSPGTADIVLMDINLGGDSLDGVETARRMRGRADYRIIFISAYADAATAARVTELVPGAPLLRKPISAALLARTLSTPTERHN